MDQEAARQELILGRELVSKLRTALQVPSSDGQRSRESATVDVLMEEISGSFARALDALNPREINLPSLPTASSINNIDWGQGSSTRRREYSSEQKILCAAPLVEDGHSWKKYGQKNIAGTKHPRSYYKCHQKKDQGCQAIKYVQQEAEDPPMFLITYIGQHTCNSVDPSAPPDQCFLSFGSEFSDKDRLQNWPSAEYMQRNDDQNLLELGSVTTPQHCNISSDRVALGAVSEMVSPSSPDPSDANTLQSLIESVAGFYYGENGSFK